MSCARSSRHAVPVRREFPRGRGRFWTLEYGTASELPDAEYPFLLTTGRVLYHWHGGTMSRRSKLDEVWPEGTVEVHPADAARLGVATGDWVEAPVAAGRSALQLVTGRSPKGVAFIPFHFVEAAANVLTNNRLDPRAKIPDYKVCAVRVERPPRARPSRRSDAADRARGDQGSGDGIIVGKVRGCRERSMWIITRAAIRSGVGGCGSERDSEIVPRRPSMISVSTVTRRARRMTEDVFQPSGCEISIGRSKLPHRSSGLPDSPRGDQGQQCVGISTGGNRHDQSGPQFARREVGFREADQYQLTRLHRR